MYLGNYSVLGNLSNLSRYYEVATSVNESKLKPGLFSVTDKILFQNSKSETEIRNFELQDFIDKWSDRISFC